MFFPLPVRLSLDFRGVRRMVLVDVLFCCPLYKYILAN